MPTVREERTGWRDEALSRRHRLWGWDCPAADPDFLLIEYDRAEVVALVEYKHENAAPIDLRTATYRAIAKLANAAQVPFFVVRYAGDFLWWEVMPANPNAYRVVPTTRRVTEQQYVRFLYRLRGRRLLGDIEFGLDGRVIHDAARTSDRRITN